MRNIENSIYKERCLHAMSLNLPTYTSCNIQKQFMNCLYSTLYYICGRFAKGQVATYPYKHIQHYLHITKSALHST